MLLELLEADDEAIGEEGIDSLSFSAFLPRLSFCGVEGKELLLGSELDEFDPCLMRGGCCVCIAKSR